VEATCFGGAMSHSAEEYGGYRIAKHPNRTFLCEPLQRIALSLLWCDAFDQDRRH